MCIKLRHIVRNRHLIVLIYDIVNVNNELVSMATMTVFFACYSMLIWHTSHFFHSLHGWKAPFHTTMCKHSHFMRTYQGVREKTVECVTRTYKGRGERTSHYVCKALCKMTMH
jgi:hypothetical protein